ncbi:RluA family pseudouridine synthase [Brumimicrobium aurantiacum]|uniref:RluA family pseudouridine synthase n=1 Tax=Brumimicrobium aurantiacum TaxID=1737063 RepID=A0A3E1EZM0_9FLAO|nr:RluA family pseudouridine synthase [Brumimicrobium aurantiacum]RFC55004.1 RluA family pseudouridine synthase [Brumimicrobium aurantiacum]
MSVNVIYEDNHLIAVNKSSGDITQGDKTGDTPLPDKIKLWLAKKYDKQGNVFCGVIHRLDRPTSGLVIFSKTSKALSRMNELFKKKEVQKVYWAIVETKPETPKGTLLNYLKKNKKQNKSYPVSKGTPESKEATLDYELIAESDRYFLLEVYPKTGRHHQIRTQLSNIGCVIKGDVKYGSRRSNKDGSISLHARKVNFIHPVKKEPVEILADVPNDPLWKWFEKEVEKTVDI